MNISFLKEKNKKYVIYGLLILLVLVVLIPTNKKQEVQSVTEEAGTSDELEQRLERVLSAMDGVGEVKVMITKEGNTESIFSNDIKNSICGVVVVCEGANNAMVREEITTVVKSLFAIDAHKISIVKMKIKEE